MSAIPAFPFCACQARSITGSQYRLVQTGGNTNSTSVTFVVSAAEHCHNLYQHTTSHTSLGLISGAC
jgi:hypothetical protein